MNDLYYVRLPWCCCGVETNPLTGVIVRAAPVLRKWLGRDLADFKTYVASHRGTTYLLRGKDANRGVRPGKIGPRNPDVSRS